MPLKTVAVRICATKTALPKTITWDSSRTDSAWTRRLLTKNRPRILTKLIWPNSKVSALARSGPKISQRLRVNPTVDANRAAMTAPVAKAPVAAQLRLVIVVVFASPPVLPAPRAMRLWATSRPARRERAVLNHAVPAVKVPLDSVIVVNSVVAAPGVTVASVSAVRVKAVSRCAIKVPTSVRSLMLLFIQRTPVFLRWPKSFAVLAAPTNFSRSLG